VDIEAGTLGVDARTLRTYLEENADQRGGHCINRSTGRPIRALVPMHAFGHPVDIEAALGVCRDFNLALVEDAAESLGSTVHGRHTGTFGLLGTLSFNGNKTITTGGGGAVLCNDSQIAKRAKHLTTTAKLPHRWEYRHDEVGYNYRLPNINAALGCAQLEQLPGFIRAKRRLFELYQAAFATVAGCRLIAEPAGCHSNYWLQTLLLDEAVASQRDLILAATNDAGLMTRPAWTLMHRLAAFRDCPRMTLAVAESLERRLINLPSSSQLAQRLAA
jgi:perosamine synthetase